MLWNGSEIMSKHKHESPISAYHGSVRGAPVQQHPSIQGHYLYYVFPWGVEQVLSFIESGRNNYALNNKDLALKTVALVALCSIWRVAEISQFDTENMFGNDTEIVFGEEGWVKYSRKGKKPWVNLHMFSPNKNSFLRRL